MRTTRTTDLFAKDKCDQETHLRNQSEPIYNNCSNKYIVIIIFTEWSMVHVNIEETIHYFHLCANLFAKYKRLGGLVGLQAVLNHNILCS